MSLYVGALPKHRYVYVEPNALGEHDWLPAVWFGLVSHPSRAWGCHLLLECGAWYRNVPLHQLAAFENAEPSWSAAQAQTWDCYGYQFSALEYPYLSEMAVRARCAGEEINGQYLFSVAPFWDGWSAHPSQNKEFVFCELTNGRFSAQPTNNVLFDDRSFVKMEWPTFLRRQEDIHSAE